MVKLSRLVLLSLLAALTGCQALGPSDPLSAEEPAPPASCSWSRSGDATRGAWLGATVEALEARDYVIRHTETQLGVVSAERHSRRPGLGAVDRPLLGRSGVWGSVGSGGGFSLGIGTGFGGGYAGDPVEVERVSVVVGENMVRITKDARVIDTGGYVVDARPDNSDAFCRELSGSIEARLRVRAQNRARQQ